MSLSHLADEHHLPRVGARPPLTKYLKEAWQRRAFVWYLAVYRIRSRFESNRLGIVWVVLRPLINALIYGLIFGLVLAGYRQPHYAEYVVVGVFFWEFFTLCLIQGAKAITGNRNLVQSLAFPRITLPAATWMEQLITLAIMLVALGPILMLFGHRPTWGWLMIIPLALIYAIFGFGVALIAARLTVHVSDLTEILPFVARILFYASGVIFNIQQVLETHPLILEIYNFYPIYQVMRIARHYLIGGPAYDYPPVYWVYLSIAAIATLVFGLIFFWSAEERYGRE